MKITKHVHSCLVFEQDGFKLLMDPGNYTFLSGKVKAEDFADVSAIFITHFHPDHLDIVHLKKIIALSKAPVYTNKQVQYVLNQEGIASELFMDGKRDFGGMEFIAMPVFHMPLLDAAIPEMTGYIINGNILHPVDSMNQILSEIKGIDLLILPTMAPFCNELQIANFADTMQPKHILPVHDGYAHDFFVKLRNQNYMKHFEEQGIQFLQPPSFTLPDGTEILFKFDF